MESEVLDLMRASCQRSLDEFGDRPCYQRDVVFLIDHIRAVEAERDALRKDAERLDFLDKWSVICKPGESIRAAIDRKRAAMSERDELAPCPFCGCHGLTMMSSRSGNPFRHTIKCEDCPGMADFHSSTVEQAIATWNKRSQPAAENHAGLPEGYMLVPKKVTNTMIDAAIATPSGIAGSPPHWQWIWDAMLAAAPQPSSPKRYQD